MMYILGLLWVLPLVHSRRATGLPGALRSPFLPLHLQRRAPPSFFGGAPSTEGRQNTDGPHARRAKGHLHFIHFKARLESATAPRIGVRTGRIDQH